MKNFVRVEIRCLLQTQLLDAVDWLDFRYLRMSQHSATVPSL